jgi:pimeloyl-ACP methyl ester carboxylesterase
MTTTTDGKTTHSLAVPGATLAYDVRLGSDGAGPPLLLIGSPMGAAGFASLASHFPDRTVVTYDPRGVERSVIADPAASPLPQDHAEDLHRLIRELGDEPVDLFASSGGAVSALALVERHPEDVRTLVAHEPPLASILPDRANALAVCRAVNATYLRDGWGAGMAHFIALVSHRGEFPDDFAHQPAPDPQMFGMPSDDDGMRNDPMLAHAVINVSHYEPDFDALRGASTRIVLGAGEESAGEMANRAAYAVAQRLEADVVIFPSHHGGFLGGEYGQAGKPAEFAVRLREVLSG